MEGISKIVSKRTGKTSYKVQIRRKGHPPQTATFRKSSDAKKWKADREAEINQSKHFSYTQANHHKFHDILERYIKEILPHKSYNTAQDQLGQLKWWEQHLGAFSLSEITSSRIVKTRSTLVQKLSHSGKPITNSTVNRYMAALSSVFTVAIKEWSYSITNPLLAIKSLPEPPPRVRYLSNDELSRLVVACKASTSDFLYPIVILAVATGCRRSELLNIKWKNVLLEQKLIVIQNTKNKTTHSFTLTEVSYPIVEALHENRNKSCAWVFPNKKGDGPIDIRTPFRNAVKKAGIIDFTFHDLRHTAASYLAMNGATTVELATALNHKSLQMVQRYAHLSEPHSAKVLQSMNNKFLGKFDDET